MDWLAFMEKKRTELSKTGHEMEDETIITHLLNSLPQVESEGAILVIKEKLRKDKVDLPEIEQTLEDKYQSMKRKAIHCFVSILSTICTSSFELFLVLSLASVACHHPSP